MQNDQWFHKSDELCHLLSHVVTSTNCSRVDQSTSTFITLFAVFLLLWYTTWTNATTNTFSSRKKDAYVFHIDVSLSQATITLPCLHMFKNQTRSFFDNSQYLKWRDAIHETISKVKWTEPHVLHDAILTSTILALDSNVNMSSGILTMWLSIIDFSQVHLLDATLFWVAQIIAYNSLHRDSIHY